MATDQMPIAQLPTFWARGTRGPWYLWAFGDPWPLGPIGPSGPPGLVLKVWNVPEWRSRSSECSRSGGSERSGVNVRESTLLVMEILEVRNDDTESIWRFGTFQSVISWDRNVLGCVELIGVLGLRVHVVPKGRLSLVRSRPR